LWNRNYFLRFRFRFRLLKSYGSGSDFWKSYGSGSYFWKVTVPVPVPASYLYHKKLIFLKKFVSFLHSKLFYKEKDYKYQQIYCKMWKKKMLNEGNQIHNFISCYGSGNVINYGSGSGSDFLMSYGSGSGSGSTRQKVTVPTVPVLQHWKICGDICKSRCTTGISLFSQKDWKARTFFPKSCTFPKFCACLRSLCFFENMRYLSKRGRT